MNTLFFIFSVIVASVAAYFVNSGMNTKKWYTLSYEQKSTELENLAIIGRACKVGLVSLVFISIVLSLNGMTFGNMYTLFTNLNAKNVYLLDSVFIIFSVLVCAILLIIAVCILITVTFAATNIAVFLDLIFLRIRTRFKFFSE